ncbi:hypothetical protein RPMA_04345 [Tardiphaga alba]|uniref:ATP-grasp domain-containing protein n=1 Tax=Tardiphaga alba TaxID=340268 RepID=A0ABX8A640_9BRAD|nr:hypothetical protein [Tardiphaga alba]QUS38164.1 hypothetical protein RPMA_04345 [Tardiphaga alba]
MTPIRAIRAGKPAYYPDQTIYAEYAAGALGLGFAELDGGTGLIFEVTGAGRRAAFGAGRGSFFPQNTATAATLANDKHLANVLMARAGIATLRGDYFFLHDRHRAHRAPGHERADALALFRSLGGTAFAKPLNGSRGDFAQVVTGESALAAYLDQVAAHYDAVIIQRVVTGQEYRLFVLDEEVVYSARKQPPFVTGDGKHALRDLLSAQEIALSQHGISSAAVEQPDPVRDTVLAEGTCFELTGRMNRSAGGTMEFAEPANADRAFTAARGALKALGLRAGAIDLFTDVDGDASALRVIEVNANPSIRFLEDSGRDDLILRIWRHTFTSLGLIDV